MKIKTTRKSIRENFYKVLCIGYCNIHYLTYYMDAFAYSTRAEGWACDYYQVGNICISTGYSPIGQRVDYNLLMEYEKKAETIVYDITLSYEVKQNLVYNLLDEFVQKVIGE